MSATTDFLKNQSTVMDAYDEIYSGPSKWRELGAKYKAKNLMDVCSRAGFRPRRVLEVGAGEGAVLMHLDGAQFAEDLHAVEIAHSGIEVIKSRNLPSVRSVSWFDGYTLPFPDNSFDAVILCHVLEHVEFERILLRELRRVAPRHLIEVPLDYFQGIDEKFGHYLGYGHINVYSPSSFRFLIKSEGFKIEHELLSITHEEVLEYNEFINMKKERSAAALAEFHHRTSARALEFYTSPKPQAEHLANAITVLTSCASDGLQVFKK